MPTKSSGFSRNYTSYSSNFAGVCADFYTQLKTHATNAGFTITEGVVDSQPYFTFTAPNAFPKASDTPKYYIRKSSVAYSAIECGAWSGTDFLNAYNYVSTGEVRVDYVTKLKPYSSTGIYRACFDATAADFFIITPSDWVYCAPLARVPEDTSDTQLCRYGCVTSSEGLSVFIAPWLRTNDGVVTDGQAAQSTNWMTLGIMAAVGNDWPGGSSSTDIGINKCVSPLMVVPAHPTAPFFLAGNFGRLRYGNNNTFLGVAFTDGEIYKTTGVVVRNAYVAIFPIHSAGLTALSNF